MMLRFNFQLPNKEIHTQKGFVTESLIDTFDII